MSPHYPARRLLSALFIVLGLAAPAVADYAWIEAEAVAQKPKGFQVGGWGNQHYLSGGNWLFAGIDGKDAEALPAEGLTLKYPFAIKDNGSHEVWARRL